MMDAIMTCVPITLMAYLKYRGNWTWTIASPPISVPFKGVIRFVKPSPNWKAWTETWRVIPMMSPMHATVAVLTALGTWNDVMTPLVIMSGSGMTTLPLAQMTFQTQFGTNYNLAFASYLLALLPILIFYIFAQKKIIGGVVNGAVK